VPLQEIPANEQGHLEALRAITRGRLDPETRAYLQRKEAEGKTRMEAMCCLKRHLARRYYRLLSD
jgi:transposase